MGWLSRWLFGTDRSEAMARAVAEAQARIARTQCPHDCATCDYFHKVAEITSSHDLLMRVDYLLGRHFDACLAGEPDSSSCRADS